MQKNKRYPAEVVCRVLLHKVLYELHCKLCHIQVVVGAFFGKQFFGGSLFHDAALVNDEDAVSLLDGGEAVGNDKGSSSLKQCLDAFLHQKFGFRIDAGCCFIQDKNTGHGYKGAGKRQKLFLTDGKTAAAFA